MRHSNKFSSGDESMPVVYAREDAEVCRDLVGLDCRLEKHEDSHGRLKLRGSEVAGYRRASVTILNQQDIYEQVYFQS